MESMAASPWFAPVAAVWLGVVGLCIGSFLNVVIARVPHGLSIVKPRSRCPKCGHALPWYENIPVFSFLALRGRCSSCKTRISWRYPAVELLTGALFIASLVRFDWTPELVGALLLSTLLVALTFIDLDTWLLPFSLTLPGIALGLGASALISLTQLRDSAIGAAVGFFGFWALEWVGQKIFKKEALGGGDKYLLALIGAFLTWRSMLAVVFLSSLQGSIIGLLLIALRGRAGPQTGTPAPPAALAEERQAAHDAAAAQTDADAEEDDWVPGPTNMPFGPWLSIAALEVLLVGPVVAQWLPQPLGPLLVS